MSHQHNSLGWGEWKCGTWKCGTIKITPLLFGAEFSCSAFSASHLGYIYMWSKSNWSVANMRLTIRFGLCSYTCIWSGKLEPCLYACCSWRTHWTSCM